MGACGAHGLDTPCSGVTSTALRTLTTNIFGPMEGVLRGFSPHLLAENAFLTALTKNLGRHLKAVALKAVTCAFSRSSCVFRAWGNTNSGSAETPKNTFHWAKNIYYQGTQGRARDSRIRGHQLAGEGMQEGHAPMHSNATYAPFFSSAAKRALPPRTPESGPATIPGPLTSKRAWLGMALAPPLL
jgi:hypothetical protein